MPLACYYTHMGDTVGKPDRSHWPVRKFALGSEPGDDISAETTAEQRLEMVWQLTLGAWRLAGLPLPTYERHEAPVRCVRMEKTTPEAEP